MVIKYYPPRPPEFVPLPTPKKGKLHIIGDRSSTVFKSLCGKYILGEQGSRFCVAEANAIPQERIEQAIVANESIAGVCSTCINTLEFKVDSSDEQKGNHGKDPRSK